MCSSAFSAVADDSDDMNALEWRAELYCTPYPVHTMSKSMLLCQPEVVCAATGWAGEEWGSVARPSARTKTFGLVELQGVTAEHSSSSIGCSRIPDGINYTGSTRRWVSLHLS